MKKKTILFCWTILLLCGFMSGTSRADKPGDQHLSDIPRPHDSRLVIELFAAQPDIVHASGLACHRRGRLLVVESPTHFPPEWYQAPNGHRTPVLEGADAEGTAAQAAPSAE